MTANTPQSMQNLIESILKKIPHVEEEAKNKEEIFKTIENLKLKEDEEYNISLFKRLSKENQLNEIEYQLNNIDEACLAQKTILRDIVSLNQL